VYVLCASVLGVVAKAQIIDGTRIHAGDAVLALAANGPRTNGYALIRRLITDHPAILREDVDGPPFLDAVLTPHRCY